MAGKAGQRKFRAGFLGFGKKPKSPVGMVKPARDKRAGTDDFRFLMMQLSFQSKYVPNLIKPHNDLILRPVFHEKKFKLAKNAEFGVPVITGVFSEDAKLVLNAHRMRLLEEKINEQRNLGVAVFGKRGFAAAENHISKARNLEKQFNDLKEKNLLIFMKYFGKK